MATRYSLKRSRSRSPCLRGETSTQKRQRSEIEQPAAVKFLLLSDTHSAELPDNLPPCDVVLHCGDLTEDGTPDSIHKALKSIETIDAELKLCIAGNHEISLDKEYWLAEGGSEAEHSRARNIIAGFEANNSGFRFLYEGTHTFTLKSGVTFKIHASPWTPKYGASAFQYPSEEDRFNSSDVTPAWAKNVANESSVIPEGIDIVMTHGPPKYILDATADGRSAGCEHLRRAIARVQPRLHCFGHIHRGYGAQRIEYNALKENDKDADGIVTLPKEWVGKNQAKRKGYASLPPNTADAFRENRGQTLMVNAAIMDEENEPSNMPWLVELEFPTSGHSEPFMAQDSSVT